MLVTEPKGHHTNRGHLWASAAFLCCSFHGGRRRDFVEFVFFSIQPSVFTSRRNFAGPIIQSPTIQSPTIQSPKSNCNSPAVSY